MLKVILAIIIGVSVVALFTVLRPLAVVIILFAGAIFLMRESKEKRLFYSAALNKGMTRAQATKWIEYNDKKMPGTAMEWRAKREFVELASDDYIFDYTAIKPNSYATKKWVPFLIVAVVFVGIIVAGAAMANNHSNIQQAIQTQPVTTQQPQTGSEDTLKPAGTQTFTSCNSDDSGGQNCTNTSNSGITTSHCNSNGSGGMNCYSN